MAYSRPRNSGVNVQQQENAANTPSIIGGTPSAKLSAAGPLRDNRDPNQILAAGTQRANEIGKFLEFFNRDVRPFVAQQIDRRAKQEAGEVLDSFESQDLLSSATPEAADAWRSLSPRARDFAIEQAAVQSVSSFGPIYAAEVTGGPDKALLARPSANNPELEAQQAEARGRALSTAQEKSGLNAIPAYTRLQYTEGLARAQSTVDGTIYKQRIAAQAQADEAAISGGLAIDLESAVTTEQAVEGVAALSAALTKFRDNATGQLKTDRALVVLFQGLQKTFANIKDPGEKLDALRRIQDQTKFPLEMNGVNLWDAPIGTSGKTMTTVLDDLYENFEAKKYIDDRKIITQSILAAETFEEKQQIIQSYLDVSDDPEALPAILQIVEMDTRLRSLSAKDNDMKSQVEFLQIYEEQGPAAADNYLKEQIKLGLASGTPLYTQEYMRTMIKQRIGFQDGQTELQDRDGVIFSEKAQQARALNRNFIDDKARALADAYAGVLDQTTRDGLEDELVVTALGDLRKKYNELGPEERKSFDFGAEMQESVTQAYNNIREAAKKNGADLDPLSPKKLAGTVTNLEQSIADSNGVLTLDLMPVAIVSSLRNGPKDPAEMNERQLATALVNYLAMFTEKKNGEDVYVLTGTPDRQDLQKWLQKRLNKARGNNPGAPARTYSGAGGRNTPESSTKNFAPMGGEEILKQQQLYQNELQRIQNQDIRENIKTRLDLVSEAITPMLNLVAGAPANAGTLENATPEAIAALERNWNNRGPTSTTDPATPQVAATTQTRRLATRITPNHEWMIAVGIAEGTRTPSGGYTKNWSGHTDPGDKETNVGTVSYSAVRNGQYLSPQQVDEQYSRQFTQTALKMTPFLEKLGLKQGTQGFNRVMFNILDLEAQAPTAAKDFIYKLGTLKRSKFSIEAIAKARADSFFSPMTGRLDAPGFGNNYQRLLSDQLSRARVFDYKKRF